MDPRRSSLSLFAFILACLDKRVADKMFDMIHSVIYSYFHKSGKAKKINIEPIVIKKTEQFLVTLFNFNLISYHLSSNISN